MGQPYINVERKFRPEVEGLRFVAALLVAIYHIWLNRVSGGVDVFFVVSGFLITTSIISTINRTGEFKFIPYITKLLKRLLPLVLTVLSATLVLSFFFLPTSITEKTLKEIIASMFYYQNWQLAISNTDYLDASQMKTPVEHFWALSIQGQFYLVWFILFTAILWLLKKNSRLDARKVINAILGITFIVSFIYSIYLTEVNQQFAYFITFTRVWEFALGGLICINLSYVKINTVVSTILGWLGLIGLILTGILFEVSTMFPGYIALWPMTCAVFIILSGTNDTRFGVKKFLGLPFMMKLGGISFGIYLWHWVLLQFYRYNFGEETSLLVGISIIVISIVLSFITTNLIEKPIREEKVNRNAFKKIGAFGTVNIVLIASLFATLVYEKRSQAQIVIDDSYPGAMIYEAKQEIPEKDSIPAMADVFDDLPLSHKDGSNQNLKKADVKVGEYGELEDYTKTIVLVGSSHSEHWLGALLEATKDKPYRVLSITRSGTRFSTGYKDDDLKAEWNNNVLKYLEDVDMDLIVSHITAADTTKPEIHQAMIDQLQYVQDQFDVEVLGIRDNPRYSFNVLESLDTVGEEKTIEKMNQEENQNDEKFWREFVESNNTFHKLDLTDYFIADGKYKPIIGNIKVYRDEKHMTNTYSKSFAPVFERTFHDILEGN